MKKLALTVALTIVTSLTFAADISIDGTYVATEKTKLPYNVLFTEGKICYNGTPEKITEIVGRMITNHQYSEGIIISRVIQNKNYDSKKPDLVYIISDRSSSFEVKMSPCLR